LHSALRFDLFCNDLEHKHICDTSSKENPVVGPIRYDNYADKDEESEKNIKSPNDPVFFFAHQSPLETSRFEFHKNRYSTVKDTSFIYMLNTRRNVAFHEVEEYFETEENYF